MNLDTYNSPDDLYLARGEDVNPYRPNFTGDVFAEISIPGVDGNGVGIVVAHPCSFRSGATLSDRLLVARVLPHSKEGAGAWRSRFLDKMPLPDLQGPGSWAAHLDLVGRSAMNELTASTRIACLSEFGVNVLQQRFTCHLTRAEVPTRMFEEAFSHTFEEAELLEEWIGTLVPAGWTVTAATTDFEQFMRSGSPNWQMKLREPQLRSAVRKACRSETVRLIDNRRTAPDEN